MDAFVEWTHGFGAWLWRASWQGSVLTGLVLLTQWLLGQRIAPRWRHTLWLLVVVRLALPWSPASRISIFNWLESKPSAPAVAAPVADGLPAAKPVSTAALTVPAVKASSPADAQMVRPIESVPLTATESDAAPSAGKGLRAGLLGLWVLGCGLLSAYVLSMTWRLGRRVRTRRPITDSAVLELLEDCKQQIEVRTPLHLVESSEVDGPSLYGFIRPRLLLPEGLTRSISLEELRYVFLHELSHVRRGDIPLNWLMTALLILHWFNPLVWFAFSRMRADRELACDALALSFVKQSEKQPYGQTIIKLLENFSRAATAPSLVGILETKNHINRRIAMIAKFRKTNRSPVLALVVLACLALIALTDARTEPARKPVKFTGKPPADLAALRVWSNTNSDFSLSVGVSSDGRYFSYTEYATGDLMVRDLFKGKDQRLTKIRPMESWQEFAASSIPSPDGSQIAYAWFSKTGIQLRLVDRDGARSRLLYQDESVGWIGLSGWSGDGRQLLAWFQRGAGATAKFEVALVSVGDGSRRMVKTESQGSWDRLTLSPDARFLAYDRQSPTNSLSREVFMMPIADGAEVPLIQGAWQNRNLGWSPDGRQLLFLSNRRGSYDCWTVRVEDGKAPGEPELLKANVGIVTPMGVTSRGGFYYAADVSSTEVQVAKLDLATGSLLGPPRSIARYQGANSEPQWSPDGKQLAYISARENSGALTVYSMGTGQQREYPIAAGSFVNPAWSADGKSIRLHGVRLDLATGQATPMNLGGFFLFPATDETVAFRRIFDKPQQILRKDLRTGQESVLRKLATNEAFGWGWMLSPNAQQLAVGIGRDGWSTLQVIPAAGGEPREILCSTNNPLVYCWLPDSRHLLCRVGKELSILSIDGQSPRPLPISQNWTDFDMNPDGQQLAFVASRSKSELWLLENAVPPVSSAKVARATP